MTSRPIILCDMDGVLSHFEQGWLDRWRARHPQRPYVDLHERVGFNIETNYSPEYERDIWEIMDEPHFFEDLPVINNAIAGINTLQDHYGEVFICTAPLSSNPRCAYEKILWVDKHLGLDSAGTPWTRKMIITKDKTMVRGDYLIDDKAEISGFMEPVWEHIVFEAPTNAHVDDHRHRADWTGVTEYFERMKLREVAEATV